MLQDAEQKTPLNAGAKLPRREQEAHIVCTNLAGGEIPKNIMPVAFLESGKALRKANNGTCREH